MKFKKLRIACSAFCSLACVLLIVLWVRSYRCWDDELSYVTSNNRGYYLDSLRGGLSICAAPHNPADAGVWRQYTAWADPGFFGFDAFTTTTSISFRAPYWFLVTVSAAIVALPWIPCRFSLRTLLIATTLLAALLGLA